MALHVLAATAVVVHAADKTCNPPPLYSSSSADDHECEIVWVRCHEPIPTWLPDNAKIVEKCGEFIEARSVLSVNNVGDEGFGYLEYIIARYATLPLCVLLLHGSHSYLRMLPVSSLLRNLRPPAELAHAALAVPLSDIFIAGRVLAARDVGRGLDVFYEHLQAASASEARAAEDEELLDLLDVPANPAASSLLPDVRGQPLHLWCCNTWLLTRKAIRQRPLEYWTAMRTAAQLPVDGYTSTGKRYAHFESTERNGPGHPEIGVIYEHVFHLMLGYELNATRDTYERAWRGAFDCESPPARFVSTR